uniref:Uncharacterized protein LOC104239114 n=1 Tax=Nicotiana sylvestris TaxID=4096 RepID=A0A1U7XZL3_NICSY|nr:PREDICTED: uncharacterized protein LOC104239114 [Nicotiana sylvestris]
MKYKPCERNALPYYSMRSRTTLRVRKEQIPTKTPGPLYSVRTRPSMRIRDQQFHHTMRSYLHLCERKEQMDCSLQKLLCNHRNTYAIAEKEFLQQLNLQFSKTEYGDIYDCVSFYQQPAFDHPLLKNHTYHPQMKPSLSPLKRDKISSTSNSCSRIGLKDGGCPMGTVPIRRTTKEDLIRERRFNASYAGGVLHFALEQTINDPNLKISGAGTTSSISNPKVLPNQWSASIVKVQNGRDKVLLLIYFAN